nr:DNA polymerase IV [Nakamurella lactea]
MLNPRPAATILHADLDAFYASVEQRDDPSLRGRPVIVGGGVVVAASYEAKARGVRTPMGGRQARALCPDAIVVQPRFDAYLQASRKVFAIFEDTTPVVEGLSIDEAFLDVGGLGRLAGTPLAIAERLRRRVADEVHLPITVGVARTKFLAKVASGVAKPDGLLLVPPESEREFLHPLPVEALWGVGKVTTAKLHALGLYTVADVARTDEPALVSLLGPHAGAHLSALAQLRDPRPVEVGRRRRSIGAQRALGRGRHTVADLDASLVTLTDRVTRRMRKAHRSGRTVVLRLRFADFTRATRSRTLWRTTDSTEAILGACRELLSLARPLITERGITLIGIAVTNFDRPDQPELPFDDRPAALDVAMDSIRDKFGGTSVTRAVLLGRDPDLTVPMLPD